MILEGKKVTLRKLVASEGKEFVSKQLDDEGNPTVKSKVVYLAEGANEEDFQEVDENLYEFKEKGENICLQ